MVSPCNKNSSSGSDSSIFLIKAGEGLLMTMSARGRQAQGLARWLARWWARRLWAWAGWWAGRWVGRCWQARRFIVDAAVRIRIGAGRITLKRRRWTTESRSGGGASGAVRMSRRQLVHLIQHFFRVISRFNSIQFDLIRFDSSLIV